ncbi:hypothetical protein CB0940_01011 [Cercospora beticola]|uniref:DUF1763-domain-containing protein n=1 Tax=Cercospora beticola TaxID=122368 RepID=A0A2G5I7V5_CERBT|nr:hypothetical protein CB0940_01011 [Cercospora beticola]PIB00887.1 hypothetical protein CB0940_01011 [Cercospora beticola]WPA96435.1 hypothetical protein RHO25_001042 [Cercospora beticola]CAK1355244.1 unnamed protein product [Cercospora beticola]
MEASRQQILLAYRHLYQHLLRAVQYAKPQRYVARDRLRNAFRSSEREQFNAKEIERTLEFLRGAAASRGMEHRIVKNLMFVWWTRSPMGDMPPMRNEDAAARRAAFTAFDETIRKLNQTMGMCIR